MIKINAKNNLFSIIILFALGAAVLWWTARTTDKDMRSELLQHARIAARTISTDFISSLSGSEKDLNLPSYQRIKSQLH